MLSLKIKDIRDVLTDTLFEHYALDDFSVGGTKTNDKDAEFSIEFRIYDNEFRMNIKPSIDSVRVVTRSLNAPDLDTIQIWLSKPYDYDKAKFKFGWRKDLEAFFDAFHEALLEKLAKTQKANMAAVYGSSTKAAETSKSVVAQCIDALYSSAKVDESKSERAVNDIKTSIFNGLKEDKEEEDEYI